MDKISVIIPCYNAEEYIGKALESLEKQTYGIENLEIIVVDDISTDDSVEIVELFQEKYKDNVLLLKNDKKLLAGGSRNRGIDICTGDYIFFLDADDWLELDAFERMHKVALEYQCDLVQGEVKHYINQEVQAKEGNNSRFLDLKNELVRKQYILTPFSVDATSKLFRRGVLIDNDIRFYENLKLEMTGFMAQLFFVLDSVYYLDYQLYNYRIQSDSVLRSQLSYADECESWKVVEYVNEDYKKRGVFDLVYPCYEREIEYFLFTYLYLGTSERNDIENDKQQRLLFEGMQRYFPKFNSNEYIMGLQFPRNRRYIGALRKKCLSNDKKSYLLDQGFVHVCFGLHDRDGNYSINVGMVINSILANTKRRVAFHIFCDDSLNEIKRQEFMTLVEGTYSYIYFHDVDVASFECMSDKMIVAYSVGALFRAVIPQILSDLPKVIYCDADIVFNIDIGNLWDIDVSQFCLGAVLDEGVSTGAYWALPCSEKVLPREQYFNSGVLLMNNDNINRKGNLVELIRNYIIDNPRTEMPDQDALNVIFKDDTLLLDEKWNIQVRGERSKNNALREGVYHYLSARCIRFSDPKEYDKLFVKYRSNTPWLNTSNDEWFRGMFAAYDKVGLLQKLLGVMCDGNKKKLFYGTDSLSMKTIVDIVKPKEDDYFLSDTCDRDNYFGVPVKPFSMLEKEEKGSFVLFISYEVDGINILNRLGELGLENEKDYFVVHRLFTLEQGGFVW